MTTLRLGALGGWLTFCSLALVGATPSLAQEALPASAEQLLADRYAPIAYLREQPHACATPPGGGEPYLPVPVELVLDNPEVVLRDEATGDVVATGPSAAELSSFGPHTYLDFPGDPLRPGCTYETDERRWMETHGLVPTIYARIAFDEIEQRLALQYWFFYYFNDWNNTHEGDWEGIQIMWDEVSSVEHALEIPPTRVGYAQHGGGEVAIWGDDKLDLEDETHLVVYPAAGAHATFYTNSLYLAWGEQGSGFGCDYSSPPSVRVPLEVVVLPSEPDPSGPFAWLTWEGRWGERRPSMFNGPVGPNASSRWFDPWGTADQWRDFSIAVPTGSTFGPGVADAFCAFSAGVSTLLLRTLINPWAMIAVVSSAGAVLWFAYRRSRDLFVEAGRVYRRHWRVFVGIGLSAVPIGILFNLLQLLIVRQQPLRGLIDWFDDAAGGRLSAVLLVVGMQEAVMLLVIGPAVIQAVKDIHQGNTPGVARSYRLAGPRVPAIVMAALLLLAGIVAPLLVVVGTPIAIWLLVRWQFFAQALVFDHGLSSRAALSESARLVDRRWWRTLFGVFIFMLLATLPGPLIGFGLMVVGGAAIGFANGISGLIYAITIPLATIAVTVMFIERRDSPPRGAVVDGDS